MTSPCSREVPVELKRKVKKEDAGLSRLSKVVTDTLPIKLVLEGE
jgi:hypothetical protein